MERRDFLKLTSALPAVGSVAALQMPDGSAVEAGFTVLRLQPDDIVCVRVQGYLSREGMDRLTAYIRSACKPETNIIVLDGGSEIGVIRQKV